MTGRCENCIWFKPNQEETLKTSSFLQTLSKSSSIEGSCQVVYHEIAKISEPEIVRSNWKCSVTDKNYEPLFQPK